LLIGIIKNAEDQGRMLWCTLNLDKNNMETFVDAIKREYWFEFFIGTTPTTKTFKCYYFFMCG